MPRLPVLSGDDFVKLMIKIGYVWEYTAGSHMILVHPTKHRLSVPRHRELDRGLLRKLISDAGLTRGAFIKLLSE